MEDRGPSASARNLFMEDRRLTAGWRVAIVVLAVWSIAVMGFEFCRLHANLADPGIETDNNGTITWVDPQLDQTPSSPKIATNDVVDLKHTPTVDLARLFAGLGGSVQYVMPKSVLTIYVRHDGRAQATRYVLRPQAESLDAEDALLLISMQCLGILFVGLASLLVWKHPSPATLGFFLYSLWYNPGQIFEAYAWLAAQSWRLLVVQEILQAVVEAVGLTGFVLFALEFPDDPATGWRSKIIRLLIPAAVVLTVLQCLCFANLLGRPTETVTELFYGAEYALSICVILVLLRRKREQNPIDSQRTRWLIWGCTFGLSSFIFADSNESTSMWDWLWTLLHWSPSEPVYDCFYMLSVSIAGVVCYSVFKERVIDVGIWVKREAVRGGTWLLIGGLLGCTAVKFDGWLSRDEGVSRYLIVAITIVASLQLEWIHAWMCARLDRLLFKQMYEAKETLARLGRSFSEARSLDAVDRLLVEGPVAALSLASATVLRWEDSDSLYRARVRPIGWAAESQVKLTGDHPMVTQLKTVKGAIRCCEIPLASEWLPAGAKTPVAALPLIRHRTLVAIALYGAHVLGDDLNADELDMITSLSEPATTAYVDIEMDVLRRSLAKKHEPARHPHGGV